MERLKAIFLIFCSRIAEKLFYSRGIGTKSKCAVATKSIGIKKAEPISSARYSKIEAHYKTVKNASSISLNLGATKSMSLLIF